MPVDRLITVTITEPTYDQAGVFQPGSAVNYRRWASLVDTSLERFLEVGGARGNEDAIFRTRYFKVLAEAAITAVTVVDADGFLFTVSGISEVTGRDARTRRRWLEVTCIRAQAQEPLEPSNGNDTNGDTNGNGDTTEPNDMTGMMTMAAPTFTELASVTVGAVAAHTVRFTTDAGAVATAWASGTYWAVLFEVLWVDAVNTQQNRQATALIPIRASIQPSGGLIAPFAFSTDNAAADRAFLQLPSISDNASLMAFATSFPPNSTIKLYGVS